MRNYRERAERVIQEYEAEKKRSADFLARSHARAEKARADYRASVARPKPKVRSKPKTVARSVPPKMMPVKTHAGGGVSATEPPVQSKPVIQTKPVTNQRNEQAYDVLRKIGKGTGATALGTAVGAASRRIASGANKGKMVLLRLPKMSPRNRPLALQAVKRYAKAGALTSLLAYGGYEAGKWAVNERLKPENIKRDNEAAHQRDEYERKRKYLDGWDGGAR